MMPAPPTPHSIRRTAYAILCAVGLVAFTSVSSAHAGCAAASASVPFGTVDVLPGAAVDITATLAVTCAGVSGAQRLCISIGKGSAGDATSRQLVAGGGGTLRFDLYQDAARTRLWGSWSSGWDSAGLQVDVAGNGTQNLTIYARLFGSQPQVAPGTYSSTVADVVTQWGALSGTSCPTGSASVSSLVATATVASSCSVSANTLDFGSQPSLVSGASGSGLIAVQCSNALPYAVALNGGNSGASDPTNRKMTNGSKQVTYGLYQDAGHVLPWGDQSGVNTESGSGTGLSQSLPVYGVVPAQTTPTPGLYTDTVVVTVTY